MKTFLTIILVMTVSLVNSQRVKYGQPFPDTNKAFEISVIHDDRPGRLLPIAAYRPPNSSFVFWSPNSQYAGALGIIMGPGSKMGKNDTAQEAIFYKINLDTITTLALKDKLQSQPNYIFTGSPGKNNILKMRPCCWIFVEGDNYEMDFELEAYYFNETGSEIWKGQYSYIVPDATPLLGAGSLIENDGELLNALAQRALNRCVETLLRDIKGPAAQWKNDNNLPAELDKYPDESLFLKLPKKSVLLDETTDEWIIRNPVQYQGAVVKIIGKNTERLLIHPIRKPGN